MWGGGGAWGHKEVQAGRGVGGGGGGGGKDRRVIALRKQMWPSCLEV